MHALFAMCKTRVHTVCIHQYNFEIFISYGDFVDMYNKLILYMCLYIFVRGTVSNNMRSIVKCE